MAYSFLVWNIRKYTDVTAARTQSIADTINRFDPDIFGILEFQDKDAARTLITDFYDEYDFGMTDSRRSLEILVGWRRGFWDQVIYTQRREFFAGNQNLRPGALVSARQDGEEAFENFLFLHTDSGKEMEDYAHRQEMFRRTFSLKRALENLPIQQREARLIALGDLNTMGRKRTNNTDTIRADEEIADLESDAISNGMRLLQKSHDVTYRSPGRLRGKLDHVIASDDLDIQEFTSADTPNSPFEIEVDGWVGLSANAQVGFVRNISDHSLLYGEVL